MIYRELLVLKEDKIYLWCDDSGPRETLYWEGKGDLCPRILRTNKRIYREASPLLYGENRFHFPDVEVGRRLGEDFEIEAPLTKPFLSKIRGQAKLIRHVAMEFPQFIEMEDDGEYDMWKSLQREYMSAIAFLAKKCPKISTVEFEIEFNSDRLDVLYGYMGEVDDPMDTLEEELKRAMKKLSEIVVTLEVDAGEGGEDSILAMVRMQGWTPKKVPLWRCQCCEKHYYSEEAFDGHIEVKGSRCAWLAVRYGLTIEDE
jgi:phage FluMu protein Com